MHAHLHPIVIVQGEKDFLERERERVNKNMRSSGVPLSSFILKWDGRDL